MILSYPPKFIKSIFPSLIWKIKTNKKELFLTFDDGPTENVTSEVLDLLSKYDAKATFFCLGKNIEKNPALFQRIISEGHFVGNHTYSHKNGWKNKTTDFIADVKKFEKSYQSKLFRPPYGKIKTSQIKILKKEYKIIMWSILTRDYDKDVSPENCAKIGTKNWQKGSILVFHDSLKAENNMLFCLNKVLKQARELNWECNVIPI